MSSRAGRFLFLLLKCPGVSLIKLAHFHCPKRSRYPMDSYLEAGPQSLCLQSILCP